MKLYKTSFATDALTLAFYTRAHTAAERAGGTMWTSLNFESPSVSSDALMNLPDTLAPDDIIPLPVPSVWAFVEEEPV